jgi:ADP-ribose pyrophosphatase
LRKDRNISPPEAGVALVTRKNLVQSDLIYEGGIINLRVDKLKLPDGRNLIREVVEHNGGVVIACRPKPDQIILIRQYRYSIDADLFELPAGRVEKGEQPLVAAQRELTEETGYHASNWREMARMYSAPGFCNELLYLYEATDVKFVGTHFDIDEEIEVHELSVGEAWKLVVDGKIEDAKTLAGLGLILQERQLAGANGGAV